MAAIKQPSMEFYYFYSHWPANVATIGSSAAGRYTSTITIGRTASKPDQLFFVEATMRGTLSSDADSIEGRQFRMYFDATTNEWDCSTTGVDDGDGGGTPLSVAFLPGVCR